jgi:sigma-B regulation protein RsbU (phosphoserine phosphatase)
MILASPEHLLDTLPCGYIIFDDRGVIEYANKTLLETVGYTAGDMTGMAIERILTVSSRIFYQTHLFPLLSMQGAVSEIFLTLKSSGGTHIPVMLHGKREDIGSGMRSICTVSTVWERKKYEKQLIESRQAYQKALEDNIVLQGLAGRLQTEQQKLDRKVVEATRRKHEYLQLGKVLMHDLQEPVRKIGYYFDRILSTQGTGAHSENEGMLAKISKSVARLRHLTDSIQRFVASEDDLDEVTALTTEQVIAKDFRTVTGITDFNIQIEGSVSFEGRPTLFAALFYELITNAVRFRKPDTPLIVNARSLIVQENAFQGTVDKYLYTDHVQIEFSDNGTGFDQRFASYIFGLFNKIEGDTEGVGLGLALCEQIIGRHHGRLSARSVPGGGTTFTILLPVIQPKTDI